ncbi:MAG TPA: FAD binding domain-containing protein [Solirubrobacteraceae bacterium]|nr:FAD binding domain-containing protein [Solirubrobacteraceae bacterium]
MSGSLVVASTLEEAVGQLAAGARPVAGGTDLVVGARQGKASLPESLVAIHRLEELRSICDQEGAMRIGALITHAELVAHTVVRSRLTALADASAIVGSHATRAFGTIGGNVMNASPAMESGGPLLCFDSTVTLRSETGTRTLTIDDLLAAPGQTTAAPGELLEEIRVPLPGESTGSSYVRLEYRRQMEIAVVGATAVVRLAGGRVDHARVAITALAPTIRRVAEAEAALLGSDGGPEEVATAAQAIAAASQPISDVRASADYRSAMAAVIGRRAIQAALARARGTGIPVPASAAVNGALR